MLYTGDYVQVILGVMDRLHRKIPPYVRIDRILLSYYYYWTSKIRLLSILLTLDFLLIKVHKLPSINSHWSISFLSSPEFQHFPHVVLCIFLHQKSAIKTWLSICTPSLFVICSGLLFIFLSSLHLLKCWLLCREEKCKMVFPDFKHSWP